MRPLVPFITPIDIVSPGVSLLYLRPQYSKKREDKKLLNLPFCSQRLAQCLALDVYQIKTDRRIDGRFLSSAHHTKTQQNNHPYLQGTCNIIGKASQTNVEKEPEHQTVYISVKGMGSKLCTVHKRREKFCGAEADREGF